MKLVGTYRAVVIDVEKGKSPKGKDVLTVTFDVTDEKVNGEWIPMNPPKKEKKFYSLNVVKNPGSKKCGAEVTAEQLKASFDFTGGFSKIGDLVFKVAELVCTDVEGSRYTNIQYVNNPNGTPKGEFAELSTSTLTELERIFAAVA